MAAEAWRVLHRVADQFVPRFADTYVKSVATLRRRLTLKTLEAMVVRGTMSRDLADAIDAMHIAKAAEPMDATARVYAELLAATIGGLVAATIGGLDAGMGLRFDVTNPYVLRAANELTADLIVGVTAETKMAVRRIIFESIRDGVAPRDAARQIRQIVGLTSSQAQAVGRYQKGLLDGGADFMTSERQAGKYAERLVRDRALTIARTETMRASNRGQQLMWTAARNEGLLPADFRQRWLVTPDDRLCPRCAPMGGREVQLGYLFRETETGVLPSQRKPAARPANVLSPPLHPRCRCVLIAVIPDV